MNRRQLAQILLLSGLSSASLAAERKTDKSRSTSALIKPKKLNPGDTVGLVLPASMAFEQHKIDIAIAQVEALGFKTKLGKYARERNGYFAGTDAQRAHDINAMFADDDVDAIFCYSGGWGSPRLLPLIDFDVIKRNPKIFLGYSDITALLNAIHQKTGLVTFHGPVMAQRLSSWTVDNLRRVLMQTDAVGELSSPPKPDNELVNRDFWTQTIRGGKATGKLVGGNLSLVAALCGTPWQINSQDAIVLLEDIDEDPYRVDRMLTQCAQAGLFDKAAGVVFGFCTDCKVDGPSFSLEDVLKDRFATLNIPCFSGFAFGHIKEMHTLPIGISASLDAEEGVIICKESAVK